MFRQPDEERTDLRLDRKLSDPLNGLIRRPYFEGVQSLSGYAQRIAEGQTDASTAVVYG